MPDGRGSPEGILQGHTEGVAHLHAKGDGRYLISNGKDFTIKMWDIRKMAPGNSGLSSRDRVRPLHVPDLIYCSIASF
jgi:WD40 repeat protein